MIPNVLSFWCSSFSWRRSYVIKIKFSSPCYLAGRALVNSFSLQFNLLETRLILTYNKEIGSIYKETVNLFMLRKITWRNTSSEERLKKTTDSREIGLRPDFHVVGMTQPYVHSMDNFIVYWGEHAREFSMPAKINNKLRSGMMANNFQWADMTQEYDKQTRSGCSLLFTSIVLRRLWIVWVSSIVYQNKWLASALSCDFVVSAIWVFASPRCIVWQCDLHNVWRKTGLID